jgi:hypothetical protein
MMSSIEKSLSKINKPVVIASHPRSGTHLAIDLIRRQFSEYKSWKYPGESTQNLYLDLGRLLPKHNRRIDSSNAIKLLQRPDRPIIKTHSLPHFSEYSDELKPWIEWLKESGIFIYIIRDGRDVICSSHVFAQVFAKSARCSLSEFVNQNKDGFSRPGRWANHVSTWLEEPNVYYLKYEQMTTETGKVVEELSKIIGSGPLWKKPLLPAKIKSPWTSRLNRLVAIKPEQTAIFLRYRGQKPPKWKQGFTREDREFFHREAGMVLIKLGYEISNDWIY